MNSTDKLKQLAQANKRKAIDMQEEAGRFARLASRHENGTAPRAISAFNLFQTPDHIAQRMAAIVAEHVEPGARILEPSAGLGRLYRALIQNIERPQIALVENSPDCVRELYQMTEDDKLATLSKTDFLDFEPGAMFDAVCMNPPFKMGLDIKHIRHALSLIRTGGVLVSLCYAGARQRKAFELDADHWELLPADTFKPEGTSAQAALVIIHKT